MCSNSIFTCIMAMVPTSAIFFIFDIFIFKSFLTKITNFCCLFANNLMFFFSKLIIFIAHSLKDSQNLFMQSLPLYISCLYLVALNDDIVDTEKSGGACSLAFVVDEFSALFLYPSIFSIKDSGSA